MLAHHHARAARARPDGVGVRRLGAVRRDDAAGRADGAPRRAGSRTGSRAAACCWSPRRRSWRSRLALAFAGGADGDRSRWPRCCRPGAAVAQPAEFALVPAARRPDAAGRGQRADGGRALRRPHAPARCWPAALVAAGGTSVGAVRQRRELRGGGRRRRAAARPPPPASRRPHEDARRRRCRACSATACCKPVVLAAVGALLFISASMTAEVFYAKDVIGTSDAGYAVLYAAWMLGMVGRRDRAAPARPARGDGGRRAGRARRPGPRHGRADDLGRAPDGAGGLPRRRRRPRRQERADPHRDRPSASRGRATAARSPPTTPRATRPRSGRWAPAGCS